MASPIVVHMYWYGQNPDGPLSYHGEDLRGMPVQVRLTVTTPNARKPSKAAKRKIRNDLTRLGATRVTIIVVPYQEAQRAAT